MPKFWLIPVKTEEKEESFAVELIKNHRVFGFGLRTPGRKVLMKGDIICFYSTELGVFASAKAASAPRLDTGFISETHPFVYQLEDIRFLSLGSRIDARTRASLDSFRGKNPAQRWAWFVQVPHMISEHDFRLLTHLD